MLKFAMYMKAMHECHTSSISVAKFNQTRKQFCIRVLNLLLPNKWHFLEATFDFSALDPVSPDIQADDLHSVCGCAILYA